MSKISANNVEKVNQFIVDWLREYAVKAGVNGFVIGISGGIDSAVTSILCAQTGLKVLCVEMPIHQHESQVSRGKRHIEQLKARFPQVSSDIVDLTPVFDTFEQQVSKINNQDLVNLAFANSRARLRMTTLYYFAGLHGLLVAGTGNKIEDFGVGFFTKYGDGGVDLSPIADLMKSDVFKLGEFLNVDESILNAAPTDGLFGDERSDADQLGANYDELEWAMLENERNADDSQYSERQHEVMKIYRKLNRANQHKMVPIPICTIPKNLI